jgi:transposase
MFLRRIKQSRQGRSYTYYSLVETVRSPNGRVRQRTICYLGRLDNLRPPDWLHIAERLPDPAWLPRLMDEVGYTPPPPSGPVNQVTMDPNSIAWTNKRDLGKVHVGLCAWRLLGLDRLFQRLVGGGRTSVPLDQVAALIAINRLVEPRSELGIFNWLPSTALPELLGVPRGRWHLNLLYRCLSDCQLHQRTIEAHLVQHGRDLFSFTNDLVLYDLTSTYFEGRMARNPKAMRGYSRDHRPDCKQLCIGLVVNSDGFPLGFESLSGNARDAQTLNPLIESLEARCGGTRRLVCFDRGMATDANLRHWRQTKRPYLCAVRRAVTRQYLPAIRQGPWQVLRYRNGDDEPTIDVQELATQQADGVNERWLLCRSAGCQLKERQMFEARLAKARAGLAKLRAQVEAGTFVRPEIIRQRARRAIGRTRDLCGIFTVTVQRREAAAELVVENAQAESLPNQNQGERNGAELGVENVQAGLPPNQNQDEGNGVELIVVENAQAIQDQRDLQGVYLLRTTTPDLPPDELWHTYMLLTQVEAAFRNMKTDLCLRPIFHHKQERGDAHVLFSVLAYAMSVTIKLRHRRAGGTLTTAALLEKLKAVGLAELSFRTADGNRLRFERASTPSAEEATILATLGWPIPDHYLPPNMDTDPTRL